MDEMQKHLLKEVAALDALPVGAYNIRSNGKSAARNTTAEIDIVTKEDKQGIDVIIKPGTKNKSVHIPVIISQTGLKELVYNDFFVGEDCDVTIIAGCGISNCGGEDSEHDGVHSFFVKKNSRVKYIEKHYGEGDGLPGLIIDLYDGNAVLQFHSFGMYQLRDVFLYHGRVVDIYHTVAVCVCCKRLCTGQYNHFGDCFLYHSSVVDRHSTVAVDIADHAIRLVDNSE